MLIVVVDRIDFRYGHFERLEIAVEDGTFPCSLTGHKTAYAAVGLIAPPADTDFDAAYGGGPGFQFADIIGIERLCLGEDILPVAAHRLAVGGQGAVGLDIDIEEDDIGEA